MHRVGINPFMCVGCGICVATCPGDSLRLVRGKATVRYPDSCSACYMCVQDCSRFAIRVIYAQVNRREGNQAAFSD